MAVVGVAKERAVMREFREDKEERYYKRVYLVVVDDLKDDGPIVERAFGLPYAGQIYVSERSYDDGAKCYNKQCNQISLLHWEVTCEYSTKQDSGGGGDSSKNPELDPPVYTWGVTQLREIVTGQSRFKSGNSPIDQDPSNPNAEVNLTLLDSTGIVNSAYEPYVPPAEMDRLIPTLTVERNETIFNHRYMLWYVNSVNSNMWYGWWPRTIKCASITGSLQVKLVNGKPRKYWKVQYVFHFNIFTWDLFLLDIGSYYLKGGNSATPLVKVPFMKKGVPSLGLLDAVGDASTASSNMTPGSAPISRFNRYTVLSEVDFGALMIPLIQ